MAVTAEDFQALKQKFETEITALKNHEHDMADRLNDVHNESIAAHCPKVKLKQLEATVFSGKVSEDADWWLERLDTYFTINGITTNATKCQTFKLLLEGPAVIWWKSLPDDVTGDINKVRRAFKIRFDSLANTLQLTQALEGRKLDPTESVDVYLTEMQLLCARAKLTESEIFRCIMRNLYPQLKAHVYACMPRTLTDLIEAVKVAETIMDVTRGDLKAASSSRSMIRAVQAAETTQERGYDPSDRSRWETPARYNGQSGFMTDSVAPNKRNWNQPRRSASSTRDMRDVECFYCRKRGHMRSDCRKRQYDEKKSQSQAGPNNNTQDWRVQRPTQDFPREPPRGSNITPPEWEAMRANPSSQARGPAKTTRAPPMTTQEAAASGERKWNTWRTTH